MVVERVRLCRIQLTTEVGSGSGGMPVCHRSSSGPASDRADVCG